MGHKLCSNDGWLVTPAEIEAALSMLPIVDGKYGFPQQDEAPWFGSWINYLARAKSMGGFRVH